jgi:DNA repair exonuclease SbcCD ATPase subunit
MKQTLAEANARITELEQRLARVAELAHDRDGDTHEWRSERLGKCASVSWDHMEESFSTDPLKRRATLKWADLAEQLTSSEERADEANARAERLTKQKQCTQCLAKLESAPPQPLVLLYPNGPELALQNPPGYICWHCGSRPIEQVTPIAGLGESVA